MKVRITRTVPGLTNGLALCENDTPELPAGLALSLVGDGYAELLRETPAEAKETADAPPAKRSPGRPRKA